ncbi:MAG: sigma-70 family RNA polymerase sigma factor [bacterium]
MSSALSLVQSHDVADAHRRPTGDDMLVERARRGDVDAFELLYRAHSARVYALCLRLTGDAVQAVELAQDVFIRAWEALSDFRGEASVATWLHRIAVNAMLTKRRGDQRRSARVALADDDEDDARDLAAGSSPARDVGTAIDLERAIASLPPGVRRAFVLHDVEGYTHEEIAEMTGLASGTLRAQLHRARQLLIQALNR